MGRLRYAHSFLIGRKGPMEDPQMKKLLVVLGLLLLVSGIAPAQQIVGSYFVDYYAKNAGPLPDAADQLVRIINVGLTGTPLTVPTGNICASIYVFDNNQEMIACCGCILTPNELATASVGTQLTNNPVTSVVPTAGVIKILTTPTTTSCDPRTQPGAPSTDYAQVFATHLDPPAPTVIFLTETQKRPSPLSAVEYTFLQTACSFAQYLGSGKGTCSCSVPGL
jgi:hypothetical protein